MRPEHWRQSSANVVDKNKLDNKKKYNFFTYFRISIFTNKWFLWSTKVLPQIAFANIYDYHVLIWTLSGDIEKQVYLKEGVHKTDLMVK